MGTKKKTTPKTDAPAKRAAKPAATIKLAAAKRAEPKKPAAPRQRAAAKAPKTPSFTHDDIALRAYFVSEKRRAAGLPGDEQSDWIEAERQLIAEHS
jgi:hypothetical protein